ncbi:MAG TPA: YcnI family protein [Acidimicrobiia bacterium]|nr:YcnI family protein [Acidimicrobiia bacterium]
MLRRVGVAGLVLGVVFVGLGTPAWAHVEVSPETAVKGSDAVLSFTVPDESDTLSTTKIQIFFPTDHPIAEALTQPIAGWTSSVETMKVSKPIQTDDGAVTEAVKSVTWTGANIEPDHFQQFSVSVGLPDATGPIEFKALQTYSDGHVVRWIESSVEGQPEPENPAPVLTLTASEGSDTASTPAATTTKTASKSSVDSAKTLGLVALILGVVALLVGLAGFAMGRRKSAA